MNEAYRLETVAIHLFLLNLLIHAGNTLQNNSCCYENTALHSTTWEYSSLKNGSPRKGHAVFQHLADFKSSGTPGGLL